MKSEDIQNAVNAVRAVAHAHLLLQDANADAPEITRAMLCDIVKRCDAIKPGKSFKADAEIDDELKEFVADAIGFCEATREEEHSVWSRLVDQRTPPVTWKQDRGIGVTIGYLDGRPVHVSLSRVEVAGHMVIFYHATSTVVDHDMVRAFIDLLAPEGARRGDRVNHTDATNMTNILPRGWQTTEGMES